MRLTLLGTGTSQGVPVLGCDCDVCKSTDTRDHRLRTSALLERDGKYLVIDVGPDFRSQMLRNNVPRLDAILLTHEHNDHIIGLDDVRPFNFWQKEPISVYGLPRVLNQVRMRFPYVFAESKYPGAPSLQLIPISAEQPFEVAGFQIHPFVVMHGTLPILGFKCGDLTYITDANQIPVKSISRITNSRTLIINALHHREHHSHFNLKQAVSLAQETRAHSTYFTHISHSMGRYRDINSDLPPGIELGYDGQTIDI